MVLIEGELRKAGIVLKRKAGTNSLTDGVATMEDLKTASLAVTLFGHARPAAGESDGDKKARMARKLSGKLKGASAIISWANHSQNLLSELSELAGQEAGQEPAREDQPGLPQ